MCGVFLAPHAACAPDAPRSPRGPLLMLTAVRLIAAARLVGLPHVADAINGWLDRSAEWTMAGAARNGSVRLLQRLQSLGHVGGGADFGDANVVRNAMVEAARGGHSEAADWLEKTLTEAHEYVQLVRMSCAAAATGQIAMLQWVSARRSEPVEVCEVVAAAEAGHLECVRLLCERLHPEARGVELSIGAAATHGHLAVVEWLYAWQQRHGTPTETDELVKELPSISLTSAALNGHLHVLQWFHRHQPHGFRGDLLEAAAAKGALDVVKWLHEIKHETSCSGEALGRAAANGHLDVVKWLMAHRSEEFPAKSLHEVARNGHAHVLRWLYEHPQCQELFDDAIASSYLGDAAEGGHLEIVQWLHEIQPHAPTWRAIDLAAANGHLDIVRWLHENRDDPCCVRAMDLAARNGHLSVVQFLHQNRREGCTQDAMDDAASHGHLEIVRFLHDHRTEGCTQRAMDYAAINAHWDVVKYLHYHRSEGCTTRAMNAAARQGDLEMMRFLHENRREGCDHDALRLAIESGSLPCVQWLIMTYPSMFCDRRAIHRKLFVTQRLPGLRHIFNYLRSIEHKSRDDATQLPHEEDQAPRKRSRTNEH